LMNTTNLIAVKGNKEGLQIICGDKGSWKEIITEIKTRLAGENSHFFKGASVQVDTGTRILSAEQVGALWQVLQDSGLTVKCIKTETQDELAQSFKSWSREQGKELSETEYVCAKPVLIVKRSLRSGQNITFDGNVLIFGDVNPGAEIIASGFIMVLGYLRGIAHAGSSGDDKAWVMSFRLQPTQLRIANCITRPPEEEPQGPELARIHEGVIVCDSMDWRKYYDLIGGI